MSHSLAVDNDRSGGVRTRKAFSQKAAKSVSEIQSNVNNMADVLVFLEVLGYNAKMVRDHGYKDMRDLARSVYEIIDFYDSRTTRPAQPLLYRMPGVPRRVLEGLALSAPWLMMLPLVFIFGVSLWMDWHLPAGPLTALALGVLLGMIISEGHVWVYSRLLLFYHSQTNVAETRRVIKRTYGLLIVVVAGAATTVFFGASAVGVPTALAAIAVTALVTMSVHRFSFTVVYTMRQIGLSLAAYATAIVAMLSIYFLTPDYLPDQVTRYLFSLGGAFLVLLFTAAYSTRKAYSPRPAKSKVKPPSFFKPLFINNVTLESRFEVQLWENVPYYLYGACFIFMMFGDRILSWFYNPVHTVGGIVLPLVFNTTYHMGADIALFVIFPMGLIQYLMMGHIFEMLHNVSLETPSTDPGKIDRFLKRRYETTLGVTIAISTAAAALLILLAPSLIGWLNGTGVSVNILRVAAVSNVFLAIFVANSSFVMLLNRPKVLAVIAFLCAFIVGVGGAFLGRFGFQDIIFAYLCSCVLAALLSSVELRRLFPKAGSLFLSRF